MSVMTWPDHLLTLDEFAELAEDDTRRYELQEGVLHVTPKAAGLHQRIVGALTTTLNGQYVVETRTTDRYLTTRPFGLDVDPTRLGVRAAR